MTPGHYTVCAMIWLATMEGSAHPYAHLGTAIAFSLLAVLLQRAGDRF